MKKLLVLVFSVMFVLGLTTSAFAQLPELEPDDEVYICHFMGGVDHKEYDFFIKPADETEVNAAEECCNNCPTEGKGPKGKVEMLEFQGFLMGHGGNEFVECPEECVPEPD
nr:hypothetical protein 5 [Desulfobulbaceae bacterium]